jgi:hypothetical protein
MKTELGTLIQMNCWRWNAEDPSWNQFAIGNFKSSFPPTFGIRIRYVGIKLVAGRVGLADGKGLKTSASSYLQINQTCPGLPGKQPDGLKGTEFSSSMHSASKRDISSPSSFSNCWEPLNCPSQRTPTTWVLSCGSKGCLNRSPLGPIKWKPSLSSCRRPHSFIRWPRVTLVFEPSRRSTLMTLQRSLVSGRNTGLLSSRKQTKATTKKVASPPINKALFLHQWIMTQLPFSALFLLGGKGVKCPAQLR